MGVIYPRTLQCFKSGEFSTRLGFFYLVRRSLAILPRQRVIDPIVQNRVRLSVEAANIHREPLFSHHLPGTHIHVPDEGWWNEAVPSNPHQIARNRTAFTQLRHLVAAQVRVDGVVGTDARRI